MSSLSKLNAVLSCPFCSTQKPLVAPVTLRCGHTLCVEHVVPTSDSHYINASSTPSGLTKAIWSSCPIEACNPIYPHNSTSPGNSDQDQKTPSKSDSLHSDQPNNPKVIFLPSRTSDFEDQRYDWNEKNTPESMKSPTDVLVSKLLSLAQRYEHSIRLLDRAIQDRASPSNSFDGKCSPVPRFSESSTPSSVGLPSSSSEIVSSAPSKEEWAGLRDDIEIASLDPEVDELLIRDLSHELTCEICLSLLYKPITTPCQHTFCSACLARSLDHSDRCPLCRQDLFGYAYFQGHPVNKLVTLLISDFFPNEYQERGDQVEKEGKDARLDTPIFICQLSFPGMPTLLHFFEPRYRLMLRRCLEQHTPSFGMIMPAPTGGATDYGTMLEIRSVQMLPDGRSMVETFGAHRFRIVERGTIDGYMVGRVERIDDVNNESEMEHVARLLDQNQHHLMRDPELSNEEMLDICIAFVEQLRSGMAPWVVQRLNHTYGPMPDDISNFTFWMGLILPLDEHEKSKLLPIRSPRLRLRLLVHWIEQLNSQWWFMNGCTVM